ncbi:nucleotidyltransferase family protein [Hyphomonas sp. FCG-A18]|uniref:nucleotidyltransferase family protein n=1 Tax=Hyphomonas sp. FCG-A18 TaxID=3080019 RepID=UPI002B3067CA|nr:nucleotidyltransferase family protein [Hyphomonas sp. FCG-A18]
MSPVPHTAMVLAAGLGTRMRPLTNETAKPLLEIAGRSMLNRILDNVAAAGVKRAIVNVHWCADQVESHVKARTDLEIVISDERDQVLETGGGLAKARPLLGDDPVLIVNTDAFWGPAGPEPIQVLAAAFDGAKMDELLLLADTKRCLGFPGAGDFFRGETGVLTRRGDATSAPWAYAGLRILKPQLYDDQPAKPFSANLIWNELLPSGRIHGLPLDRFWLHVGDPQALKDAEMWVRCNGG